MKVVHVEMGRHLYGGARQVAYLLNGLKGYDSEHLLVCTQDSGVMRAVQNARVNIQPIVMRGDLDIGFLFRLYDLLRQVRPDVLHVHSRKGDLLAIVAGRLAGLPVVYSRRVDNPPNWFDRWLKFPLCSRVVTISEGIRTVLRRSGVSVSRLTCIRSAIDTTLYSFACDRDWFAQQFEIKAGAKVAAIVAQLIPRKGHLVLFDALECIVSKFPELRVLVFGQGGYEAELKQEVTDRGLSGCVKFVGFRSDLPRILPCLDVLVHPAWMEGLGVSLLEAAASGVPIIASRAGGMPEIVQDGINGYLIEPGDVGALATRLEAVLNDDELAHSMGRAGIVLVQERFAVAGMVAGNHALYLDVSGQG